MTSRYVMTERATSAVYSMMWFLLHNPGDHRLHSQTMLPVPCGLTASQLSIAKAGSLSNATAVTRSMDSDPVTLSPKPMPAPSSAFITITGMNNKTRMYSNTAKTYMQRTV